MVVTRADVARSPRAARGLRRGDVAVRRGARVSVAVVGARRRAGQTSRAAPSRRARAAAAGGRAGLLP